MKDYLISYAQNREDIILKGFFENQKNGFYVDIGAYHPTIASVTKFFYDSGWTGINIEPNPTQFKTFKQLRKRDINIQVGVSDKKGELIFREYPNGMSTFSEEVIDIVEEKKGSRPNHKDYKVQVTTLEDIFNEYNIKNINFLKIDVEGFEYEVIEGNDWEKYRPEVLCIEADHIVKDWRPLLRKAHYDFIFFDGLNEYYVAKEHSEISKRFSYINTMLLGKAILPAHFKHIVDQNENLLGVVESLQKSIVELNFVNESLNLEIIKSKRVSASAKRLLVGIHRAFLVRIENLRKRKARDFPPLFLDSGLKPASMIKEIKKYDSGVYFDTKTGDPFIYKVAFNTYRLIHSIVKSCGIFSIKVTRKVLRG